MADESRQLSRDFRIDIVAVAPAALEISQLSGKELVFVFADVTAQWPNVSGSGQPDDLVAVFADETPAMLEAVIHWSHENVDIDMQGSMSRANGGNFVQTAPLAKFPGHPTSFPSEESWFEYRFADEGTIRLGLFFEGSAEKVTGLRAFGQSVEILDEHRNPTSDEEPG